MKARGRSGRIRVGGREAAALGRWKLTGTSLQWTVEADLISTDEFLMASNGPFEVRLNVGRGEWIWRKASLGESAPLTITVSGRPEMA